ncbi:MAG: hypothetical protein IJS08_06125 [Victivallales bacterium]|nr:hypothetical protein [Victivallales bacterium]
MTCPLSSSFGGGSLYMKDKGNPVSLFSFQDIVTSLTGIMVIVILVIVLQLAEATYDYENPKEAPREYHELKAKIAELTERIAKVKQEGDEIPEELKPYLKVTEEELASQLERERLAAENLINEKDNLQKEMEARKLTLAQIQEQLRLLEEKMKEARKIKEALEAQLKEIENDEELARLAQEKQKLEQQCERIRNDIRIEADKVEFSFRGTISRKPILIECAGSGFRAQVYKEDNEVMQFTSGSFNANLDSLLDWLKKKDLKKCYPVLLFRRGGFAKFDDIVLAMYRLDSNMPLGMEPLDDNVKVF